MRTTSRVLAASALALVALAACGSDDDPAGAGTATSADDTESVSSNPGSDVAVATAPPSDDSGEATTVDNQGGKVELVAYSTPQEAYGAIIEGFKDTPQGAGVDVTESYGGSGDQSRAVESGQPADYVGFSLEGDVTRLVKAGLVAEGWNTNEYEGIVTDSVVVLVVREGNPKGISGWEDLTKEGVEVVTPNPFTSGGARWNVMGAYGSQIEQGKSEEQAIQFLHDLFANVVVQDASARESLQTFAGGVGDVLIAYENEAIFAQQQAQDLEYIVPDQTILIENPVSLTAAGQDNSAARAFYDYVFTAEAQQIFLDNGYRPVNEEVAVDGSKFPTPTGLFTIADFGGWSDVMAKFFNPDGSVMVEVERAIGVSIEQ